MRDDDKSVRDAAERNVPQSNGDGYNGGVVVAPPLFFINGVGKEDVLISTKGMYAKMSRQGLNEIGRTGFNVLPRRLEITKPTSPLVAEAIVTNGIKVVFT